MSQNLFTWWLKINEKEPWLTENWNGEKKDLINIKQWWWIFKPFNSQENNPFNLKLKSLDNSFDVQDYNEEKQVDSYINQGEESFSEGSDVVKDFNDTRELKLFREHSYFPIIDRFTKLSWVDVKNYDMVAIAKVFNEKKFHEINSSSLNNVDIDSKLKGYLSNYISKIEELNPKNEWKQLDEIEIPKEFDNIDALQDQDNDLVQLLAKNHTRIPDWKDWSPDFSKDIETTFKITLNKLIDWKQFQRTESFDLAVNDIKNWDIETKFVALSYVYSLVNTKELLKWAKTKNSFDKIKWDHNEKKQIYLDFKIEQLGKQIKNTVDNKEKLKLTKELDKVINEKNENDFEWEIFKAWEIDVTKDLKESKEQI